MKNMRSFLAIALAFVTALSLCATLSVAAPSRVEAAGKEIPLSATRYRYPIMRFENAKFRNGIPVDENQATSAFLSTTVPKFNGKAPTDLIYARVEEYDMFNMKVGKNKALKIQSKENTSPTVQEDSVGLNFHFGKGADTREDILPPSIKGIPIKSTDHGIMLHLEIAGTPEHPEDGYSWRFEDGQYYTHKQKDFNLTFQEWDFKADGTPKKKKGKVVQTAMNIKPGAKVTLIWTKPYDYVNPDPKAYDNQRYVLEESGKGVIEGYEKDANGKEMKDKPIYKREPIPETHYKPGDSMILTTPKYTLTGKVCGGGGIDFPVDFCGYVIIPFSEFQFTWNSADYDGLLNFKKMELVNLYSGFYHYHRSEITVDEYAFWGPTFAKVDGAFDYGNITFANHKDSLINRKRIKIAPEVPSEEPSKEAPSEIKTDLTLTNKDTGIVIEAPATAKLDNNPAFHVDIVDPDGTDYNKILYTEQFSKDRTLFKSYNLYFGEDGDQQPADFVQINFPIPEGLNPDKCQVYTLSTDTDVQKVLVDSKLSDDKTMISIKVDKLQTYIIFENGGEEASAQEDASAQTDTPAAGEGETSADLSEAPSENKADKGEKANLTWLWIVLAVVVVAGGGVAVYFLLRKKAPAEEVKSDENPSDEEQ